MIPRVYKLTENHTSAICIAVNIINLLHDVVWFSIGYKNHCACLTSDSCTSCSWLISNYSTATGAGITRMQLATVVITSALVFATCAEGLPEGKIAR